MKKEFKEFSSQIKKNADKKMDYFLVSFFILGLIFAIFYNTWFIAISVGSISLMLYYLAKFALPGKLIYQYILSAVIGIFSTQYIFQMHGMFEMHFVGFIGSAILISYRNWKLQIPLAVIDIMQHVAMLTLGFSGYDKIYNLQLDHMTMDAFIFHGIFSTTIFTICGIWAYHFKISEEKHVEQSFEIGRIQEAYKQKDLLRSVKDNLRESEELLNEANHEIKKIFDTVEEVLFSMDMINNRLIEISGACTKVYGYTPDEFREDNQLWIKVIHPHDKYIIRQFKESLYAGKSIKHQFRIIHKDKSVHWVEKKIVPTLNDQGALVRLDGICNDITDRIILENKLTDEKKQKRIQITAAVITAQENERYFLGEELHDNINPILATAKLYIDCAMSGDPQFVQLLKESKGFITTAMNEIRTLSKSLVPPSLGEVGLVNAIADLVVNIHKVNDLEFICNMDELDESILSENLKLSVYRIIQEQVTNILKHAHAKTAYIGLKLDDSMLELKIKDDGIGFDASEKKNGVGLQNIHSRTELYQGHVTVISKPGKGCELIAVFNTSKDIPALKSVVGPEIFNHNELG